jgi:two-component system sensor histidine kinase PilS (NtrC family)
MDNHRLEPENLIARIHWLMLGRVAIATFLLGIATLSAFKETELLSQRSLTFYYIIIVAAYGLSFFYLLFLSVFKSIKVNVYIQTACDVALITYMVYVTGGTSSIYSVFYTIVIIYSALFLGRSGSLIIASACSIFYGTLLDLEYYELVYPLYSSHGEYPFLASYVFARIFTHILSFYLIAFLASFVVEREKRVRALLAEKEDAFEQLDMLHRIIVESVSLGILTINPAGRIKSFNRAAQDITDFTFSDVEDKDVTEIFPFSADLLAKRETYPGPAENRYEVTLKTSKNRKVVLGCSLSSLKNNSGEKIGDIMIIQDLTAIKKIEESYEKSRRMALIGEMAFRLAHEIRNPLASISGSIQMLSRDLQLPDTDEKLMRIILRGKEQLEFFMKDFLLLARPTPGAPALIDVREIIEDVLEALQFIPDWHEGIEIKKNLWEEAIIHANRTDIRHVIWNLLLNALQAMPAQGILKIETRRGNDDSFTHCLEIAVSDTGNGIEENDLGKIFEPFYTTKERGTGLGLAIVNRIVEYNKGNIKIESEVGRGTKCFVRLPISK